jgi:hypothetical protein
MINLYRKLDLFPKKLTALSLDLPGKARYQGYTIGRFSILPVVNRIKVLSD